MPPLGESAWCETCGRAYLTRNGHNCPGPRNAKGRRSVFSTATPRTHPNPELEKSVTDTLEHETPEKITDTWMAALRFIAFGSTSRTLRAVAADSADPALASLAVGIANAMASLEAEGMTPEDCFSLAGLDREFGPYMSPDKAVHVAAEYMTAGWSSKRLPDATRPEVAAAIAFLESLGVTAATAARITEAGTVSLPVPAPRTAPSGVLSAA